MKSIIITGTDVELNNALQKNVANYNGELEIVYASPFSQDLLENVAFSQPDFIIADFLNEEEVKAILESVIKTTIVFISKDTNRTNAVISNFNKQGVFDFINLDKNQINPKEVLNQLKNYDPSQIEEVEASTPISSEVVENPISEVKPQENLSINQESETEVQKSQTPVANDNVETNINSYKPIEEPIIAKPIDKLSDDVQKKQSSEKIVNISQCQVVTLYSKKGGTGNTTIAKEIANIFANATLSKRLSDKPNLETIIVDFDFEQGNLRTLLGITNPNPNVYSLIDAILTKMEQGIPLERIYFAEPEFKINYCLKLKNSPMYVLCLAQGDVPKRLVERMMAFGDDEVFTKIIKKIIQILKNCFNIVIIDTTSSYNDINEVIFRYSNKIVYPMEPTLADLENFKVTLDETKEINYITNKIIPVVNKGFKSRFNESFVNVYEEIQKVNPELKDIVGTANYDTQVINYNNNYGFYSMNQSQFKQIIITLCHNILPIFKTRSLSDDMKIIQKKKAQERKKLERQKQNEATKKLNQNKVTKKKEEPAKTTTPVAKENNEPTSMPVNDETGNMSVREYLTSDLSGKDVDAFINDLKGFSDTPFTKKGFPKVAVQPKSLNKKVWKQYQKKLYKSI